jgi:hypothetical protein
MCITKFGASPVIEVIYVSNQQASIPLMKIAHKNKKAVKDRTKEALRTYFLKVKKGASPEQTRKDCGLSLEEIQSFDFSVFYNKGPLVGEA